MKVSIFLLLYILGLFRCNGFLVSEDAMVLKNYVFWPNATVPFYINPKHFDQEQSLSIMTSLSLFAFKTCLKFAPVMVEPKGKDHVMVFENPGAVWRCKWSVEGHSIEAPHIINLGYECLKSPHMEMTIMKALGFPFEHNRASRDLFIDVQFENIEPGKIDLFTKDSKLPIDLRNLPYDINSVMHFNDRQFSKNGHRTIIFKDRNVKQSREGLSDIDLRKVEIVYGPECQKRDRQEKIDLCQIYPGVARKKRDLPQENENLRVNRDIKPVNNFTEVAKVLSELGIEKEVEEIIDQVYNAAAVAVENARKKYCNQTKVSRRDLTGSPELSTNGSRVVNIMEAIANFAQSFVDVSIANLTVFCETMDALEAYQRAICNWGTDPRCQKTYRSTKSGDVRPRTQHRPTYYASTKNVGHKGMYNGKFRADDTKTTTAVNNAGTVVRKKRKAHREGIEITEKPSSIDAGEAKVIKLDEKIKKPEDLKRVTDKMVTARRSKDDRSRTYKHKRQKYNDGLARSQEREEVKRKKKIHHSDESEEEEERVGTYNHKGHEYDDGLARSQEREEVKRKKKIYHSDESEEEEEIIETYNHKGQKYDDSVALSQENEEVKRKKKSHHSDESEVEEEMIDYTKKKIDDDVSQSQEKLKRKNTIKYSDDREQQKERIGSKHKKADDDTSQSQEKLKRKKKIRYSDDREEQKERIRHPSKQRERHKNVARRKDKELPRTVPLSKKNKEFYNDRKWPAGIVSYVITEYDEYNLHDLRSRLEKVNAILKQKTCVQLQEISEEQAYNHRDYLVLDTSPDYVTGRVGGRQVFGSVELFKGVSHRQHTAMMVMAMLGFYFEVSRHDRDQYIVVHTRHIRPDKLHHFEKIRADATLALPYDYKSATHPSWQFWRRIGMTGISSVATFKDKDTDGAIMKSLGQHRELLSALDIVKINSVYGVHCFKKKSTQ